jgi:L-fuculose-phosphate aldolase
MNYPAVNKSKKDICEVGRRLYNKGFVAANDGNISVRVDKSRILITPTGVSKGFLESGDIVTCDITGKVIVGDSMPSSEIKLHLEVYRRREDALAVVHAHPPYATAFAVAGLPLTECILPEVVMTIGRIPLAPYGTPSTEELPRTITSLVNDYNAILLSNHGTLTFSEDVYDAYYMQERIEHLAKISLLARQLGGARTLTIDQLTTLSKIGGSTTIIDEDGIRCSECGVCGKFDENGDGEDENISSEELIKRITDEVIKGLGEGE